MKPLTAEEIAELRKRHEAVVKGYGAADASDWVGATYVRALPRLLDEVERSRALLKRIADGVQSLGASGLGPSTISIVEADIRISGDDWREIAALMTSAGDVPRPR